MQHCTRTPGSSHSLPLLFPLLLLVSACGGATPASDAEPATPVEGAAPAAPATPTVDLARVGTLDPPPRGKYVIPVTVTADGAIHAFGKSDLSLIDLRQGLQEATRRSDWREPDNSSRCILLVNADAALPWVVSHWILMVAAEPTVLIYQACFAAHPRDAEEVGVLSLALPRDRGIPTTQQFVDEIPVISLKMSQGEGPAADPEAVGPALKSLWMKMGRNPKTEIHIELPATVGVGVPTEHVLQTLDVAIRTGLTDVLFRSPAPPSLAVGTSADRLQEYVRKLASGEGTARIRIHGQDVGTWPADRARPDVGGILPDHRSRADGVELPPVLRVHAGLEFLDVLSEAVVIPTAGR